LNSPTMSAAALDKLQRATFGYFLKETNPANGLVPDNTRQGAPCSIAAVGLGLAAYAVGAERDFVTREEAVERTLVTLQFFWNSRQGEEADATGCKGFYYHFLDMQTGRRTWKCELSTIDSAYLLAGALTSAAYFDRETEKEREIRKLADALYCRADWVWAQNGALAVSHGWRPERGFIRYRWQGYNEALLLYVLGLGSPTRPLPVESYRAWTETYRWRKLYGYELLYAGPLFVHQLSHVWIDFRGIQDDFMRGKGIDYFENSRRATYMQRGYAMRNPKGFKGYHENCWGVTASDGPGPATRRIAGIERRFYDYLARSIPYGPDDGTIAPWAAVASLPFAPEIVLPALHHFDEAYPDITSEYGFKCSFNPTFSDGARGSHGWISKGYYGLDQGPIVLMIENYRSDLIWRLTRKCAYIVKGLRRAGFAGGWLSGS
jgi:hypothetical protein